MNAQQLLTGYGISMQQAFNFLIDNLSSPQTILNVAQQFSITNGMLAEIISTNIPGVTEGDVKVFFASNGLNSSLLDKTISTINTPKTNSTIDLIESLNGSTLMGNSFFLANIDASTGSFNYLVDPDQVPPKGVDEYGHTPNFEPVMHFSISGFGADDYITIQNQSSLYFYTFNSDDVQIVVDNNEKGYVTNSLTITLNDVNPQMISIYDVTGFNALTVGDLILG